MYILGVSALYHDSAACIIRDGEIIAAAQEERFSRVKHDSAIPVKAINYCIREARISCSQLEAVVYYDQPISTLERFLKNVIALGNESSNLINFTYKNMFGQKLWIHKLISDAVGSLGKSGRLLVVKHHISHAASAFYPQKYVNAL